MKGRAGGEKTKKPAGEVVGRRKSVGQGARRPGEEERARRGGRAEKNRLGRGVGFGLGERGGGI